MELRIMDSEVGSRRLHDDSPAARKLLAAPAPSPYVSTNLCHDVKSGVAVSCQNPHTLVIIVAGMACMIFLVTIALVLLLWSVVRQRRIERLRREAGDAESPEQTSTSSSSSIGTAAAPASGVLPVDSPEFKTPCLCNSRVTRSHSSSHCPNLSLLMRFPSRKSRIRQKWPSKPKRRNHPQRIQTLGMRTRSMILSILRWRMRASQARMATSTTHYLHHGSNRYIGFGLKTVFRKKDEAVFLQGIGTKNPPCVMSPLCTLPYPHCHLDDLKTLLPQESCNKLAEP